jgi:hypothetical protein
LTPEKDMDDPDCGFGSYFGFNKREEKEIKEVISSRKFVLVMAHSYQTTRAHQPESRTKIVGLSKKSSNRFK